MTNRLLAFTLTVLVAAIATPLFVGWLVGVISGMRRPWVWFGAMVVGIGVMGLLAYGIYRAMT